MFTITNLTVSPELTDSPDRTGGDNNKCSVCSCTRKRQYPGALPEDETVSPDHVGVKDPLKEQGRTMGSNAAEDRKHPLRSSPSRNYHLSKENSHNCLFEKT